MYDHSPSLSTQKCSAFPDGIRLPFPGPDATGISFAVNSDTASVNRVKEWYLTAKCNDKPLRLKVVTGASCNVMLKSVLDFLAPGCQLHKHYTTLVSFSGHKLNVLGKASLLVDVSNKFYPLDFVIVDSSSRQTSLLGFPSCQELDLLNVSYAISEDVTKCYGDVFQGLGRLPAKHALQLKDHVKPVIQSARRVPFRLRDRLKSTLDSMVSEGTIAKVKEATDWVHPIVLVQKPNGAIRICLDPSELNKNLKREHFALPTSAEIFSKLSGSKVFTTLDCTSGFLQLELDDESSLLTTFATPFGCYRFLRLPYGFSSSPEIFSRTVSEIFEDIPGVECYVDNILVHAASLAEHDAILKIVLERCRERNLRLNESKCKFRQSHSKYLGHVIGNGGVQADPSKIKAILDMPEPKSKKDVRRVLGMATNLAKFCPNLSEITTSLRDLTKESVVWS